MAKTIQDLLEGAIFEGCGDATDTTDKDRCRTQLNLTQLHKLLCTIIDNQTALQMTVNDADERLSGIEVKGGSFNNKEVLPQLKSRSSLLGRSSSLELAKENVANFASKNEIDKLNTRLDLFQTKLDNLTNIVPSNEDLLQCVLGFARFRMGGFLGIFRVFFRVIFREIFSFFKFFVKRSPKNRFLNALHENQIPTRV